MAVAAIPALVSLASTAAASAGAITATTGALVAAAATTAGTYMTQREQAKMQAQQQKAYNDRIHEETIRQYGELSEAEQDALYDSHQGSLQAQKEYMQARSNIELQSAASGTYGQTVDVALEDLRTGKGQQTADIIYRRDRQLSDINRTAEGIRSQSAASFDRTPIKRPSILESANAGLQAGISSHGISQRVYRSRSEAKRRS